MSLGKVSVAIEAQMAGFEADMGRAARVAEKEFKRMEAAASRNEAQMKAYGKTIGLGVVAAVGVAGLAMKKYIENTIQAEKVQAQLEARIRDTGGAAQRSIEQLNAMADELQSMTVFDDEAIGEVQAMLLTFKNIAGVNFDTATGSALDMATVMGTDATAAALQLGKALNDPILGVSALGRAGVQFTKDQKEMIKSLVDAGDVAGAQQVILKELEGQMGTAAEAARGTLGGALQALQNSFDNLLEGDSGSDGMRGAVDAVNSFNETLNDPDIKAGADSAAEGIIKMANSAVTLIAMLGNAGSALAEFYGAADKRSIHTLNSQISDKEGEVFATQRSLKKTANVPWLGAMDADSLKKSRAELAELEAARDRVMARNAAASRQSATDSLLSGFNGVLGLAKPKDGGAGSGGGSTKGASGKSSLARDAERMAIDNKRRADELLESQRAYSDTVLDMAARLQGPVAQALNDHRQAQADLTAKYNDGRVTLADYGTAQELLTQIRDKDLQAIAAQQTPAQQMMADMQAELSLMGLSSIEREKAIALRQANVNAMSAEGQSIADMVEKLAAAHEAEMMVNDLKSMTTDFAVSALSDLSSAGDAFEQFGERIKRMAIQMLAEKAIQWLFGAMFGGGGASGEMGGLSSLFGGSDAYTGFKDGGAFGARLKQRPRPHGVFVMQVSA